MVPGFFLYNNQPPKRAVEFPANTDFQGAGLRGGPPPSRIEVDSNENLITKEYLFIPYGNRTRVSAAKGRCPRPLDERNPLQTAALYRCLVDLYKDDFLFIFTAFSSRPGKFSNPAQMYAHT